MQDAVNEVPHENEFGVVPNIPECGFDVDVDLDDFGADEENEDDPGYDGHVEGEVPENDPAMYQAQRAGRLKRDHIALRLYPYDD